MKTTFLVLTFLLYVITFAAADLNPVFDIADSKLVTGVDYFIVPISGGEGGGVTLASVRNKTCQLDVAQDSLYRNGLWVRIHPVNIKKGISGRVIRQSTDLIISISSTKTKTCGKSTIWKVDNYDKLRKRYFVTIGGVEGYGQGQSGWFRILKENNYYKIIYCSQVQCKSAPCDVMCKNVGPYSEHGRTLFALTDKPYVVYFEKVIKS
ncbi:hypothetical protein POM88_003821 [Heracleum sosnowskyi]|uniref:Uncharacterized protein n=1 Tax=Heracleum sosnowskyi TaxID=360622 RepID=A0AAD8JKC6_9APIA|nr:hypothetical protein POM88_003821 [Heracleum sosnowskyi]